MAITDKEEGVWELDEVYNKINQGGIWSYDASDPFRFFGWGKNTDQILAVGDNVTRSSPTQIGTDSTWGAGKDMPQSNWYAGSEAMCSLALKQDGTLWSWGENKKGSNGRNQSPGAPAPNSPSQVGTNTTWYQLSSSKSAASAVKSDGTFWTWGSNQHGQLGLNSTQWRSSPAQVGTDTTWDTPITSNNYGQFAVKTDGTLWVWGQGGKANGINQPGPTVYSSPKQIPGTTWTSAGHVSANGSAIFVKSDGTLWTWGANGRGQLGLNQPGQYSSPVQVGTDTTWKSSYDTAASIESSFALAIKTDGTLWSWGYNRHGQLGLNEGPGSFPGSISSPTQVGTDNTWDTCAADQHDWAGGTKTDGTAWVWGDNLEGKLGLNQPTPTKRSSPTQIPGTDWAVLRPNYNEQVFALKKGT